MSEFLIIGASGLIGTAIRDILDEAEYVGTYSSQKKSRLFKFDIATDDIESLQLSKFKYAILLGGIINPDKCFREQRMSQFVNVERIKKIINSLKKYKIKIVFASTEAVYNGANSVCYAESSEPKPLMVYAQQKLEIERFLSEQYRDASVSFRVGKVYGTMPGDGTLLDVWFKQLQELDVVECADDYISSVVHVDDVAKVMIKALRMNLTGVYNLGGPEPISRFGMCNTLFNKATTEYGYELKGKPMPCEMSSFHTLEPRPLNLGMDSSKLEKIMGESLRNLDSSVDTYLGQCSIPKDFQ